MSLGLKPNKKDVKKSLTFFDFCAGIGGGRLGLELNGLKCLGFSEIDRAAIKTYKEFFSTKDELENGQTLCSQHNFLKKNLKQTQTGKKMFIRMLESAKSANEKALIDFLEEVLEVYEKHNINGHIVWKK